MSRTLTPSDAFKYIVVVLLAITTYSCSAVRKNNVQEVATVAYETEKPVPQIKNKATSETAPRTADECECEDAAENETHLEDEDMSETPLMEIFNSRFYYECSKKLGLELDGTENKDLIKAIDKWFGTRYKWGGCSKYGIDCSCFVKSVYKEAYGIELNRTSRNMYYNDLVPVKKEELQEGDILCFKIRGRRISHVGIYLKDNKFVHAARSKGVMINDLTEKYYKKRFFSGGRVIGREGINISKY